jgi:hypothetical protein
MLLAPLSIEKRPECFHPKKLNLEVKKSGCGGQPELLLLLLLPN